MRACLNESPPSPEPEVSLWTGNLDALSASELAQLHKLLDKAERERAARFPFEKDRQNYIAARGWLRELIADKLKISPASIQFTYGARGKPTVAQRAPDGRALHFNLSHSAGWAMFACAWEREIGIDVESTLRLAPEDAHLSALAGRILSSREFDLWHELPDAAARHAAFLRAWTRKEAYAKATGAGVFDGLREIEVILDAMAPQSSLTFDRWIIHDLDAPDGFAAALAVAHRPA